MSAADLTLHELDRTGMHELMSSKRRVAATTRTERLVALIEWLPPSRAKTVGARCEGRRHDTKGEILDVGRAQRLVTAAIFTALVLRDSHCAFPGCARPPIACDAHHIVSWLDGGPTSLNNLVLLCRAHHTILHSSGWQVRLNPVDRRPEFKPPPGRHRFAHGHDIEDCYQHDDEGWVRERILRP